MDTLAGFFRYLPRNPQATPCGLDVLDAGYTLIPPGMPYPPQPHPPDHDFNWRSGRTLQSFTFVYISSGQGHFESRPSGLLPVRAGNLFVLFPGVWHRYRPAAAHGWHEHWVELDGPWARQLLAGRSFTPARPILHLGVQPPLLNQYDTLLALVRDQPPGFEFLLAAETMRLIAMVESILAGHAAADNWAERITKQAQAHILSHSAEPLDVRRLARRYKIGYSLFRQTFKRQTGLAPLQFQLQIRLNRACHLLTNTALPVSQIADELGFTSLYYFSRLFSKKLGCPPTVFRQRTQSA
jgi:AraC-like DNA-binding protein